MTSSHSAFLRRVLAGAAVCILLPAAAFSQSNPPNDAHETRVKQQALSIPQGGPSRSARSPVEISMAASDR